MPSFEKFEDLQNARLVHSDTSAASADRSAVSGPRQSAEKLLGTIIDGRYQLLSLIGEGGMGFVFKAKQLATGRMVAIKTIASGYVTVERVMRFSQEGKAACAFSHPNAVAIYDVGVTPDGMPYMSMQYVEGITLSEEIERNGPLPEKEGLRLFSQVADALVHAHQKHVLHRDIKPSNIMLVEGGRGQRSAMLLDFGIAKYKDVDDASMHLTKTGEIVGTPFYMSPEQCQGAESDQRSDVYAFGCVMYETLTGTKAVTGENFLQVLANHVHNKPTPISEHAGKAISDRMQNIIYKAIEKEPKKRFQSMSELWEALQEAEQKKPLLPQLRNRNLDRGQGKLIVGALLAVTIVSTLAVLGHLWITTHDVAAPPVSNVAAQPPSQVSVLPAVPTDWQDKYISGCALLRNGEEGAARQNFIQVIDVIEAAAWGGQPAGTGKDSAVLSQKLIDILKAQPLDDEFNCLGRMFQEVQENNDWGRKVALKNAAIIAYSVGFARNRNDYGNCHDLAVVYEYRAGDRSNHHEFKKAIDDYDTALVMMKALIKRTEARGGECVDLYFLVADNLRHIGDLELKLNDEPAARKFFLDAEHWYPQAENKIEKQAPSWAKDGQFYKFHADNLMALNRSSEARALIQKAEEYARKNGK